MRGRARNWGRTHERCVTCTLLVRPPGVPEYYRLFTGSIADILGFYKRLLSNKETKSFVVELVELFCRVHLKSYH